MRWMNVVAALSGAAALIMLAAAHHLGGGDDFDNVIVAAIVQLSAAAAALAIANREGLLNEISGALTLVGADLFAGEIYWTSYGGENAFRFVAPIGGAMVIAGWVLLAFARPGDRT